MGNANSNANNTLPETQAQTSDAESASWENTRTEQRTVGASGITITPGVNGEMDVIDFEVPNGTDSATSSSAMVEIFEKMGQVIKEGEETSAAMSDNMGTSEQSGGSSPFISTELYKKIMEGGGDEESSSPFIATEVYKKIMNGGKRDDDSSSSSDDDKLDDSESSTSSSELMKELSQISLSSSDNNKALNKPKRSKHSNPLSDTSSSMPNKGHAHSETSSSMPNKGYGYSETSSDITTNREYFVGGESSDTPYRVDSSSINTSDINLVSVDSVNGRRYL